MECFGPYFLIFNYAHSTKTGRVSCDENKLW
jgi:hypothetical protein